MTIERLFNPLLCNVHSPHLGLRARDTATFETKTQKRSPYHKIKQQYVGRPKLKNNNNIQNKSQQQQSLEDVGDRLWRRKIA
jgi:hypothetical protein